MPALVDVVPGATAVSTHVQQLIDQWTARRNAPAALTVNDPVAYALTLKNSDAGSRGIIIYAADGTTVLFSVDSTGAKVSHAGAAAQAPVTDIGPAGGQAAEGNHVHGAGGYAGTGAVTLEALYAASWTSTAINYAVAAAILYVFCTAGVTVTLPAAATTNRPITIKALVGTTTVASAGGSVNGGSVNTTTGLVMDGTVSPLDAITYKSNGTNWYAV